MLANSWLLCDSRKRAPQTSALAKSATRRPLRRRHTLASMRKFWREDDVTFEVNIECKCLSDLGTSLTCMNSWGYRDNLEKCSNGSPAMHQHVQQRHELLTDVDATKSLDGQRMHSMGLPAKGKSRAFSGRSLVLMTRRYGAEQMSGSGLSFCGLISVLRLFSGVVSSAEIELASQHRRPSLRAHEEPFFDIRFRMLEPLLRSFHGSYGTLDLPTHTRQVVDLL